MVALATDERACVKMNAIAVLLELSVVGMVDRMEFDSESRF